MLGTDGTALDPDVELKGFTVFGSTQAAYNGAVVGPGNVVVNGALSVSSGTYFVGDSTFPAAGKIYVGDGSSGQILSKNSAGSLEWTNSSAIGDNLGDHNATQRLNMAGNQIMGVSSLTVIAPDTMASSLWVSTSAITPQFYVSTAGYVGIGTATPADILHIKKQYSNVVFGEALYNPGNPSAAYAPNITFTGTTGLGAPSWDGSTRFYYSNIGFSISHNGGTSGTPLAGPSGLGLAAGGRDNDLYINSSGNVGIGTTGPGARMDVVAGGSTPADMAQIWRDGSGTVVSSLSATGVMMAAKFIGDGSGITGLPSGDNLGNHVATTTLNMNSWNLVNVSSVNFLSNVFLTSATAAQGGGVYVSTNLYTVGFSSAAKYYGDGSTLTGVSTNTYHIGDHTGGGVVYWVDPTGTRVLIAAAADQSASILWGNNNNTTGAGLDGIGAGKADTVMISTMQGPGSYAARFCQDYAVTGADGVYYDDWYLPSKAELQLLSAQKTVVGGFTNTWYWSSTEYVAIPTGAWLVNFNDGSVMSTNKMGLNYVRCVRGGPVSAFDYSRDAETVRNGAYVTSTQTFTGANTFTSSVTVPSAGNFYINDGSAGQVLSKTAAGNLQWTSTSGLGDNLGSHIATTTLQMGVYGINSSSAITAAYYQIAGSTVLAMSGTSLIVGRSAGSVNTASNNVFAGYSAGSQNTTGAANSFLGYNTGQANVNGSFNSFYGDMTGFYNTSGSNNVFLGYAAGMQNRTGYANVVIGNEAGDSVAVGSISSCTIIGYQAGAYLLNGVSKDILIGYQAGTNMSAGSGNIIIGNGENPSSLSASNELDIGGVLYGDLAAKTIGISTRAPQAALDVVSTGTASNIYAQIWRDGSGNVVSSMTSTGVLYPSVPASDNTKVAKTGDTMTGALYLSSTTISPSSVTLLGALSVANGNVGIGAAPAAERLAVSGNITATGSYMIAGSTVVRVLPNSSLGIGVDAGRLSTGFYNTIVGYSAGSNATGNYNTVMGYQAGLGVTSFNSFFGYQAGYTSQGSENAFFGNGTGWATSGNSNAFFGYQAGYNTSTGGDNSFLGNRAGLGNTTGGANTFVGKGAAPGNTTGSANAVLGAGAGGNGNFSSSTIVGFSAGGALTTGNDNIFLGWQAGYNVTSGTGNIVVGYNKGTSAPTSNNELNIGGVLYGDLSAKTIGISTRVPQAALDIVSTGTLVSQYAQIWRDSTGLVVASMTANGKLTTLQTLAGDNLGNHIATTTLQMGVYGINSSSAITAGYYQINGSTMVAILTGTNSIAYGVAAGVSNIAGGNYNVFIGNYAGTSNTTGNANTANGYQALYANTTGSANTANGANALKSNTGDNNTANGASALYSNTTGSQNTANGYGALYSNTNGSENTANGYYALRSNTGGYYNTANGKAALYSNTIGSFNTANGHSVLFSNTAGSYNTANGYGAIVSNTTGNNNIADGYKALYYSATGSANSVFGVNAGGFGAGAVNSFSSSTIMGYQAGYNLTTGNDNILLGWQAGDAITSGADNIVIGYNQDASAPTATNELNLGGVLFGNLSAKTIGISTRVPGAALDIVSTGTAANVYAQIWRDGSGNVVSSMTSTGVLYPAVPASDNTKVAKTGDTMTGQLTVAGSSLTVSYGVSAGSLTVTSGQILTAYATAGAPTYSFTNAATTGLYKSNSENAIHFSVVGASRMSLDSNALYMETDGTAAAPSLAHLTRNAGFFWPATDQIAISNNGIESVRFSASGNVGIGTENPGAKLDVNGTVSVAALLNGQKLNWGTSKGSDSNTNNYLLARLPVSSVSTFDHVVVDAVVGGWGGLSKGLIHAVFSNRDQFTYTHTLEGNMSGCGALRVYDNGGEADVYLHFEPNTYCTASVSVQLPLNVTVNGTPNDVGATPAGTLEFDSNSASYPPVLTALSNGNVGIGTTAPASRLSVQQTSDPSLGSDGTGAVRVYNAAGTSFAQLQMNSSGAELSSSGGTFLPFFLNTSHAAVPPVTISTNGNVGIGTASPGYLLDVNGKSNFSSNIKITPNSETWGEGIQFYMPSQSTWGGLRWVRNRTDYSGSWYVGYTALDATNDLVFGANNSGTQNDNILRLTTAGNVGIGITNPTQKLQINGITRFRNNDFPAEYFTLFDDGSNRYTGGVDLEGLYFTTGDRGFAIRNYDVSQSATRFYVSPNSSGGNVGIGTTSPGATLDVNGTVKLSRYLVQEADTGITLASADFGKTITVNSVAAQTVTLPAVTSADIGATITVVKLGAGNVTIQAAASTYIADSSSGGTVVNNTATQTWATVTLRLATATMWVITAGDGVWTTY